MVAVESPHDSLTCTDSTGEVATATADAFRRLFSSRRQQDDLVHLRCDDVTEAVAHGGDREIATALWSLGSAVRGYRFEPHAPPLSYLEDADDPYGFGEYGYLRNGVAVPSGASWNQLYAHRGGMQHAVLASSGMSALTAAIVTNSNFGTTLVRGTRVGVYYETMELFRYLDSDVEHCSLTPESVHGRVIILDELGASGLETLTRLSEAGGLEGVVGIIWDTSLRPREAFAVPEECKVPIIAVRSHVKLDQLGLEVAGLGVISFLLPARMSPASLSWARHMIANIRPVMNVLGLHANPLNSALAAHVMQGTESLAVQRNELTRIANSTLHSTVSRSSPGAHLPEHGFYCMFPLPIPKVEADQVVERMVVGLVQDGAPVSRGPSFGLPFTTISAFPYDTSDPSAGTSLIRVACAPQSIRSTEMIAAAALAAGL